MITLALDTTGPAGSVAVCRGDDVLAAREGDAARPHGEHLPGDLLTLLAEVGLRVADVDLFAVAAGPGAFTGLRIGIAAVQGFAFARQRPAVGVSALEAHAVLVGDTGGTDPGSLVGVWMDAARGEVFAALYELPATGTTLRAVAPVTVGRPEAILDAWEQLGRGRPVRWVGSGVDRYRAVVARAAHPRSRIIERPAPVASGVARLARAAHDAGDAGMPHAIQPIYVRRPDAELARDRRASSFAPPRS
jgi:tRNA threonylcarbamoyladenosine biosynthesis protein TsaB